MPALAQVNPRVAPVVRALEDHYRNVKTLQAIFLERYSDSRQSMQLESGTVYFSRPGRMRWDYESPEKKALFLQWTARQCGFLCRPTAPPRARPSNRARTGARRWHY